MAENSNTQPGWEDRFQIALRVLKWSSIGLIALAIVMIIAACIASVTESDAKILTETAKYVFSALLPLLGTWVGTIIAFYFSTKSFETASESVLKTVKDVQKERLETYIAGQTMRPYDQIEKVELDDSNPNTMLDVKLEEHFARKLSRKITRIPVFTKSDHVAQYMIHGSVLYEFFSEIQSDSPQQFQKDQATLKNLIEYKNGKYKPIISATFAFVGKTATLAAAKSAMERIGSQTNEPCQDVFVTETGNEKEGVLGWLSDKRIEKYSHLEG